jgi:hypothetical protein
MWAGTGNEWGSACGDCGVTRSSWPQQRKDIGHTNIFAFFFLEPPLFLDYSTRGVRRATRWCRASRLRARGRCAWGRGQAAWRGSRGAAAGEAGVRGGRLRGVGECRCDAGVNRFVDDACVSVLCLLSRIDKSLCQPVQASWAPLLVPPQPPVGAQVARSARPSLASGDVVRGGALRGPGGALRGRAAGAEAAHIPRWRLEALRSVR